MCVQLTLLYSVQSIFDIFDMKCMYFIYQTKGALGIQSSVVL